MPAPVPRAVLLRTERPRLLPREIETHAWYEAHLQDLQQLDLEVIYDNAPGDWIHYSETFRATWRRARAYRVGMINSESDVVPTLEAFRQVLSCPEQICTVPYVVWGNNTGLPIGHSAVIETRVPGGWECHLARGDEAWSTSIDLGFVRYSAEVVELLDIAQLPVLTRVEGLLNQLLNDWFRDRLHRQQLFHLHWPALRNNHVYWDEADRIRHPPEWFRPG